MSQQVADISVIICAYTEKRWDDLVAAVASIQRQTVRPREIIVVIDENSSLFTRASVHFHNTHGESPIIVMENQEQAGLSGARNTGIATASGDIIAFLDDDAMATPIWVAQLIQGFADANAIGVGGAIVPVWDGGRPAWFPEEFDWVVGCTYRGMPTVREPIRNLIGANMSFRRAVFDKLGGFRNGVGQVGESMLRCDDTEFCIRVGQQWPQQQMLYLPEALVYHHVPTSRATWGYFRTRCYTEGLAKALVSKLVGAQDSLSSEWAYTLRILPTGILNGLTATVGQGDFGGLVRAFAIAGGLTLTTAGYLIGRAATWQKAAPKMVHVSTLSMEKSTL